MKIAIVDDEKHWRDIAAKEVRSYYQEENIVDVYSCGEQLLQGGTEYDIIFLDVEMDNLDGFEIATKYKARYPDCIVLMFTMHMELSRMGYMVNAFRYIDKENMSNEIPEALMSIDKLLLRNQKIEFNVVSLGSVSLVLKDILFIETEKRNIRVHTRKKDYICSNGLKDIEEKLTSSGFCRCHKSYVVNLDAVETFNHFYVYMVDGSKAMVSSRKYIEFKRRYLEHKFEQANG